VFLIEFYICSAGNLADKALAKALKMDRKRKSESASDRPKKKKPYRQSYGGSTSQAVAHYSPHVPPPQIVREFKPETRTCLGCRQQGHLLRHCPRVDSGIPAALGAPRK